VVFSLAGEEYGIQIEKISEVIKPMSITPVPNSPKHILGIIDLRGKIILVLDLKNKFGLKNKVKKEENDEGVVKEDDSESLIIVIEIGETYFGFEVDGVKEVLKAPVDSIKKTPEVLKDETHGEFLNGVCTINDRLILLLDPDQILNEEEINSIKNEKTNKNITKDND